MTPAAGLSSSSALVVGISTALVARGRLEEREEWRQAIHSKTDLAGYLGAVENGLAFSTMPGAAGVGTHGGSEDHAAILEGRPGYVSAFAFVPARALGVARIPTTWRFVIAPSGVAARKTGAAREPYNRLSNGTRLLLDAWNVEGPRMISLAAALNSNAGAPDRLRTLTDAAATSEMPASWLRDRLQHFIREDERALLALAAFDRVELRRRVRGRRLGPRGGGRGGGLCPKMACPGLRLGRRPAVDRSFRHLSALLVA